MRAFFLGTTIEIETPEGLKKYKLPGYLEMLDLVWAPDGAGGGETYRGHPERIANLDETYLGALDCATGVAPKGARHAATLGEIAEKPITALCGATLSGYHFSDLFVFQGKFWTVNCMLKAAPGCRAYARPDGYMMTGAVWKEVLKAYAEMIPGACKVWTSPAHCYDSSSSGGVSPTKRFLLVMDGHASRLDPECLDVGKEIGFDMLLFPGGMTAVLQVMDQLFGSIKKNYTQRIATERVRSSGKVAHAAVRIKVWCEAKTAYVTSRGTADVVSAARRLGLYPPSLERCLENLKSRTSAPVTEALVAGGEPDKLSTPARRVAGLKTKRISDLTEVGAEPEEDEAADSESEEPSERRKKTRRVNYPQGFFDGSQLEAMRADLERAKQAADAEKEAKRAAKKEQVAANKAAAAERKKRGAERRANAAAKKAAKAAKLAAAARAAEAPATTVTGRRKRAPVTKE